MWIMDKIGDEQWSSDKDVEEWASVWLRCFINIVDEVFLI